MKIGGSGDASTLRKFYKDATVAQQASSAPRTAERERLLAFWQALGFEPIGEGALSASEANTLYGHHAALQSIRLQIAIDCVLQSIVFCNRLRFAIDCVMQSIAF